MGPGTSQSITASPRRSQSWAVNILPLETRLVPIRVLYTLNTSPQFLLARQRRKIEVVLIPAIEGDEQGVSKSEATGNSGAKQGFARVSLKACLGAVCNSSPELLSDRSRDYSVYVLDPLECSPNDGGIPQSFESLGGDQQVSPSGTPLPCPWGDGVSIGMGLMSWCLSDDRTTAFQIGDEEEGYIIGKLVKDRGTDALEVVMSLRETVSQTQRQHALSLSSWGLETGPMTSSPGCSSPSATQLPPSLPLSPRPHPSSDLPASSQPSTASTSLEKECLSEPEETLPFQVPSWSAPDSKTSTRQLLARSSTAPTPTTRKCGRPPGATTHPEKRARRLAIQSHREKLERMENIAKMQNGEPYDKTLIIASELAGPRVTSEEIARQRRILEELESRPLIVDQSSCLTKEPMPKKARSPASTFQPPKKVAPKRKGKSSTQTNAEALGSGSTLGDAADDGQLPAGSTSGMTENQRGAGLLLSLLTSVLGKVDEPSVASTAAPVTACQDNRKGKAKEIPLPIDNALAGALHRLLPLLPNSMPQSSTPSSNCPGQLSIPESNTTIGSAAQSVASASGSTTPHVYQPKPLHPQKSQRLFKTTEENFYSDTHREPNWPYDRHWAGDRPLFADDPVPKVRQDAHPVPGGGWARGRNLVPRVATPQNPTPPPPEDPALNTSSDKTTQAYVTTPLKVTDKESKPPSKAKRGLKRSLSALGDAKENAATSNAASSKTTMKKRKQESLPAVNSNAIRSEGTKRAVMGSTRSNRPNVSKASNLMFASSPVRTSASTSATRGLPVMAMSEPDYFSPVVARLPIIASSDSSHLAIEAPKTPPRRDRLSDDDVGGSLFTPASASQPAGNVLPSGNPLFSPSPRPANSRGSHVDDASRISATSVLGVECQCAPLAPRNVSTGWDLPPSSPPAPTSPISPSNDLDADQNDQMDFEFATQLHSELNIGMEKGGTDGRFEDHGTMINCADVSTPAGDPQSMGDGGLADQLLAFHTPVSSSDFDPLSEPDFDFDELGQIEGEHGGGQGIELDIEQLWSSLGPVIAQAHTDPNVAGETNMDPQPQTDFAFFDLGSDQEHVGSEGQGGVDAVKLAEDLKALFGGCVV